MNVFEKLLLTAEALAIKEQELGRKLNKREWDLAACEEMERINEAVKAAERIERNGGKVDLN